MDIIILILCTFFIINRLMKMLGQYDPDEASKRQQKTTVIMDLMKQKYDTQMGEKVIYPEVISPAEAALPEEMRRTIIEIKKQDVEFDVEQFVNRAQKAYVMYVNALGSRDMETLKNLVDKEMFDKISTSNSGVKSRIKDVHNATLTSAMLYGDRAILTVSFTYSIISFLEDENGNLISGSKDRAQIRTVHVTFCRYITQEKYWKITKDVR